MGKVKENNTRPMSSSTSWSQTRGGYIAGRACIDEADLTAAQMETKWGAGRLRLLVPPEIREKFDRQRYLLNGAIWHGDLDAVRREAKRMVTAWLALDRAATAAGKAAISPHVWEVALADGTVAAIVPSDDHACAVNAEGRAVAVYTLDEIARLLSAYPDVARAKLTFPGAKVTAISKSISDPLDAIREGVRLNDPLDDNGGTDGGRSRLPGLRIHPALRELSPKVGDGGNREGGISWGCLTPPLLHRRSDMPCPKITSSS